MFKTERSRRMAAVLSFFLLAPVMGFLLNLFWFTFQIPSVLLASFSAVLILLCIWFFSFFTSYIPDGRGNAGMYLRASLYVLLVASATAGMYLFADLLLHKGSYIRVLFAAGGGAVALLAVNILQLVLCFRANRGFGRWFSLIADPVLCVAVVLSFFFTPLRFGSFSFQYHTGQSSQVTWSPSDTYDPSSVFVLEKQKDRDFVILNISDIQLTDMDMNDVIGSSHRSFDTARELIEKIQPDLITLSGDISCGFKKATENVVEFFDSFGIPWAPVMGNHDHEVHTCDDQYMADQFMAAKHCLFDRGPAGMGVGNYIINIVEKEGDTAYVVQSLIMMDTHSERIYNINGRTVRDYDHVNENQIDWYRWAVENVQAYGRPGETVKSTVILHIPLFQYNIAFDEQWDYSAVSWKKATADRAEGAWKNPDAFGVRREKGGLPPADNGFFDVIKQMGSTENVLAGHDHVNNYSLIYEGVRLTYGMKLGDGCYWDRDMNGCTVLTVHGDGTVSVHHRFADEQ